MIGNFFSYLVIVHGCLNIGFFLSVYISKNIPLISYIAELWMEMFQSEADPVSERMWGIINLCFGLLRIKIGLLMTGTLLQISIIIYAVEIIWLYSETLINENSKKNRLYIVIACLLICDSVNILYIIEFVQKHNVNVF